MQYFGLNKPNSALINMICENFLQDLRYAYIYVQYCNTFIVAGFSIPAFLYWRSTPYECSETGTRKGIR